MSEIKKCQYAGDKNDEYCVNCNGVTMLVNGEEHSCTECAGYVADTSVNLQEEVDKEIKKAMNAPVEEDTVEDTKTEESTDEAVKEATESPTESCNDTTVVETVAESEEVTLPDGVTVKSMRYMSGMTICHNDTYYKFSAEEEWELDANIGADAEAVESIREKLWAKLNLEVDNQVAEVIR